MGGGLIGYFFKVRTCGLACVFLSLKAYRWIPPATAGFHIAIAQELAAVFTAAIAG